MFSAGELKKKQYNISQNTNRPARVLLLGAKILESKQKYKSQVSCTVVVLLRCMLYRVMFAGLGAP